MSLSECLHIVEVIDEIGGSDTIKSYLAIMMATYSNVREDILNGEIDGKKVKDLI